MVGATRHGSQPGARLIVDACVAAGFEPRIVAETDHAPIVHGLVAAGVGVDARARDLARRRSRPGSPCAGSPRPSRAARSTPSSVREGCGRPP